MAFCSCMLPVKWECVHESAWLCARICSYRADADSEECFRLLHAARNAGGKEEKEGKCDSAALA
eukprot:scaffold176342_cov21-Tisochrysis_lutea.AAC.1